MLLNNAVGPQLSEQHLSSSNMNVVFEKRPWVLNKEAIIGNNLKNRSRRSYIRKKDAEEMDLRNNDNLTEDKSPFSRYKKF